MGVNMAVGLWLIVFTWAQLPVAEFQTGKHFLEIISFLGQGFTKIFILPPPPLKSI
jgi:hypothetical protein